MLDNFLKWLESDDVNGLHRDIFRAALFLKERGVEDGECYHIMRKAADHVSERQVPDREINSAIRSANLHMEGKLVLNHWPQPVQPFIAEVLSRGTITRDHVRDWTRQLPQDPVYWLRKLYKDGELVCAASDSTHWHTADRDLVANILSNHFLEYINPSPMSKPFGLTQENRQSAHCLDNVGPRTYLVIEFDRGTIEEHANILWFIGGYLPLFMMVYSGGKSMHGWYYVKDLPESTIKNTFTTAVELGADPKMWSKCQFTRLPCGRNNKTHKKQVVTFFDETKLGYRMT